MGTKRQLFAPPCLVTKALRHATEA